MDPQWRPNTSCHGGSRMYPNDDEEENHDEGYNGDPVKDNYRLLVNRGSSCEEEEEEDRNCHTYEYDESVTPVSSDSDDSTQGKIESNSQVLYGAKAVPDNHGFQPSSEYDEEHKAQSSSSDTSPRYDLSEDTRGSLLNNRTRYSRHNLPSSAPGAMSHVDDGIAFFQSRGSGATTSTFNSPSQVSRQPSTFGDAPYSYSSFNSSNSGANLGRSQLTTVRGMTVPSATSSDVRLEMPNDDKTRRTFMPGGSLRKTASSKLTRDGSPVLSQLDQGQGDREMSDLNRTRYSRSSGYVEDRYGNTDSLEHQHPSRNTARACVDATRPTQRTGLLNSGVSTPSNYNSMSTTGQENSKLAKKQERKKKKAEMEKKSWRTADDQLGKMEVDEILAELGESVDTNGKKKKREQRKVAVAVDKKKEEGGSDANRTANKKKDNQSKISKKKYNKQTSAAVNGDSSQFSARTSDIIQTTSNDRVVSRIFLNGRPSESREADAPPSDYSERNIDEAIAKSEALLKKTDLDLASASEAFSAITSTKSPPSVIATDEPISDLPPLLVSGKNDLDIVEVGEPTQNIDVTYNVNLDNESVWVEEEFVRVPTPEPAEEEFKQVVHKKKKPHAKVQTAERESNPATVNHTTHMISSKPGIKVSSKKEQKTASIASSQRPASPPRKISDVVKDGCNASEGSEYDYSEKAFPLLSGDHKQPMNEQQVVAAQNSWAAKVANSSLAATHKNFPKNVGGGDHLTNETFPLLQTSSNVSGGSKTQPGDFSHANKWDKPVDYPTEPMEPCRLISPPDAVTGKEVQCADNSPVSSDTAHAVNSTDVRNEGLADETVMTTTETCTADPVLEIKTHKDVEPCLSQSSLIESNPLGASPEPVTVNVPQPTLKVDSAASIVGHSLATSASIKESMAARKSTGAVEFVGQSFSEESPRSNIQFGFDFDEARRSTLEVREVTDEMVTPIMFEGAAVPGAVDSETESEPVDILPMLQAGNAILVSHCQLDYPAFLRKIVRMLTKEWHATAQALELSPHGTKGRHRFKKVKRWSAVMD